MTAIHRRVAVTALLGLLAGRALADANTDEFFRAIRQDNDAAVRSLLARGFNPNTKDEKGTPGLVVALQEGALRVASLLIDSPRLVPETRNAADESPLMMAALKGHAELARRLIARDADVNKPGWTPLHYAAAKSNEDMVKLLLSKDALPNAPAPDGTSPLMMAAQAETVKPTVIQMLIDAGADPYARNLKGDDAIDVARKKGNTELANALEKIAIERRKKAAQGK